MRRAILEEANRLYRNWRNRLHHHYLAFETKEEALEHVPDDICDSDWHFLVDHFSSPAFEVYYFFLYSSTASSPVRCQFGPRFNLNKYIGWAGKSGQQYLERVVQPGTLKSMFSGVESSG